MVYQDLSLEQKQQLEASGSFYARYGSLIGHAREVDDAIRLPQDSEIDVDKLKGYRTCGASTYFNWFMGKQPVEQHEQFLKTLLEPAPSL